MQVGIFQISYKHKKMRELKEYLRFPIFSYQDDKGTVITSKLRDRKTTLKQYLSVFDVDAGNGSA